MPTTMTFNFEKSAGTDKKFQAAHSEPLRLVSAKVCDVAGVAAHASNYVDFQILGNDQTAVIAKYSTQDTADGALTAGAPAALTLQNKDKLIFTAGERIEISAIHAGTGQNVDATITAVFEVARSY